MSHSSASGTWSPDKYSDWLTNELITWVRNVPQEEDAVSNIQTIIKAYENRKSLKERIKAVFR